MSTRVVLHTEATSLGGAEVSLRHLAGGLHPSIDVVVAGSDAAVVAHVAADRPGCRTLLLPSPRSRTDGAALLRQRRALAQARPDLVHLNLSWAGSSVLPMAAALSLHRVPVVAVEQLSLPVGSPRARVVKRLMSARLAAHVSVGEKAGRDIERDNGLPPGSLRVVHNGVPDRQLPPRPPTVGPPVLGCLARFVHQKGLDVLLRALPSVPDARLVLVGGGSDEPALRSLAAELGVTGRVELRSWVADGRALLPEFDVFVLPSRAEGFPLSVVEAMLAGVPVVATDVGSTREAIEDGVTGRLVLPDDVDGLAGALRDVLAEPGRTVEAARGRALDRFTDRAMARGYEQVYADVLGRPVGRAVPDGR